MKKKRQKFEKIKKDFPILKKAVNNKPLVYLDSAATSLKPKTVIKAINAYYREYPANVFRGLYSISQRASKEYEKAREKTARFIGAQNSKEIIFTRNTTEAINLIAYSYGRLNLEKGDEIITTIMEHHSNFVPWQELAAENQAILKIIDINKNYQLQIADYNLRKIISKKTKLLVITHVSNVLGVINPIKKIIREVKKTNPKIKILVDGAQAVPHMKVNMQDLGCDFYVFSGHKMMGPTGIGVLWARQDLLNKMAPFNFGGGMISKVEIDKTFIQSSPHKFEAGTPHIAGVIGLSAAIDYLEKIGFEKIFSHEKDLVEYALTRLNNISYLTLYSPKSLEKKSGVIAFNVFDKKNRLIHPHDIAQILSEENICVRAGHHCAMPLHKRLKINSSIRISFYIYNTKKDINKLVQGLEKAQEVFNL